MRERDGSRGLPAPLLPPAVKAGGGREAAQPVCPGPAGSGRVRGLGLGLGLGRELQQGVITGLIKDVQAAYSAMTNKLNRGSLKLLRDQSYSWFRDQETRMWK